LEKHVEVWEGSFCRTAQDYQLPKHHPHPHSKREHAILHDRLEKVTGQKEIGPDRTQFTLTANGTMNGNIEVTDTGEFVSVSKNNLTFDQGQGVIKTKDGSETANYNLIDVFNSTDFQGASAYSTNSTRKLSFLNNIMGIYKGETDENGNYESTEWHWK
jgi:hypothetical protein